MSAKRDSKQLGAVQPTASNPPASSRDALTKSGDYTGEALFASQPVRKPSTGAMRKVSLPPPVPPPPPVSQPPLEGDFGFDLDFSRPLDVLASSPEVDFTDGPSVETELVFEDSAPSHLKPIAAINQELMPDDAFEFADATEVSSADSLGAFAEDPDARLSDPGLEMELPLSPSVPVPSLSLPPRAGAFDPAARRAERAERVRVLIAQRDFADALDLIELLRAGSDDSLAAQLEAECVAAQQPRPAPPKVERAPVPTPSAPFASRPPLGVTRSFAPPAPPPPPPPPPIANPSLFAPPVPPPPPSANGSSPSMMRSMASILASAAPSAPSAPITNLPEIEPIDELGGMSAVLSTVANSAAIRTLDLDHRAGFLLSLVDGFSSVEDLLDVANLPTDQCLALLVDLKRRGLIR